MLCWPGTLRWPAMLWPGIGWPGIDWPGMGWPGIDCRPLPFWPGRHPLSGHSLTGSDCGA